MKRTLIPITAVLGMSLLSLLSQTNRQDRTNEPPKSEGSIQALEQQWADAVKRRDVDAIDRIQAEEYIFTGPTGQVWTKAQELDTIKAVDLRIDSFELSEVEVRLYENTAVVTLRIVWQGRFRDADISGPQRMTDVFVKRDGRWQCVASQATRIPPPK